MHTVDKVSAGPLVCNESHVNASRELEERHTSSGRRVAWWAVTVEATCGTHGALRFEVLCDLRFE